jgi:membrane protein implicated in regulation of membrane protease activity
MTGWLIFSWIWSSRRDLDLLFEWLDPKQYEPPSTIVETTLILSFGILLAALLFAAKDPRWYAILFTAYSFVDVLANRKVQSEVGDAISKSKERVDEDLQQEDLAKNARLYANGLETLEHYFVRRRHDLRTFFTLVASTLGLLMSVMWWATASNILGFASYTTFVLILVGGQITVWRWRLERDVRIRPIRAELNELTRLNQRESRVQ